MSIDEHGVDVVFCSCLQPAHLVIAEVSQAPMGWWKASTMFFGADAFNQGIGAWNISAVTDMGQMFRGANATKQPIGAGNASSDQHVVDGVFCMWLQPMCPRSWLACSPPILIPQRIAD